MKYNAIKTVFSLAGKLLVLASCLALANTSLIAQPVLPTIPPDVQLLNTDPTALVGTSSAAVTFVRSGSTNDALEIEYLISGTASNGVDFKPIASKIAIPAGYLAHDLLIEPLVNMTHRGNKTITLTLATNNNYEIKSPRKATINLVDDIYNDQAPSVALVSPTNGTVAVAPTNITLQASAADADGAVKYVSFYANDTYLGRATNSPFSLVWSNAPLGHFALFARAVDELGKSTISAPVQIVVTNAAPTIKLLSPASSQTFGLPAMVEIKAEAADADDAVRKVQIYGDGKILATFTNSPYSLVWSNVAPGSHTVTAKATDKVGLSASTSVKFTVTNAAPSITLVSPTSGGNFKEPAIITLKADASDKDGGIKYVVFWVNRKVVAIDKQSPYEYAWKYVKAGVYSVQAEAIDIYGRSSLSEKVTIAVSK